MKRKKNMKPLIKQAALSISAVAILVIIVGLLIPERLVIPVHGATPTDWNHNSFWFRPWGKSGVHRGIDIFAPQGREVISSCNGIVICKDSNSTGGKIVAVLGPKWRIHYFAHLHEIKTTSGRYVSRGEVLGTVGCTGNAAGKPPHLHYAIITQIPYPWLYRAERFGADRMFYLNPHERLMAARGRK